MQKNNVINLEISIDGNLKVLIFEISKNKNKLLFPLDSTRSFKLIEGTELFPNRKRRYSLSPVVVVSCKIAMFGETSFRRIF